MQDQNIMNELKHSGLGIASFITSIISGIILFTLVGIAGFLQATTPGGLDENSAAAVIIGLLLFAFVGALLVALGLGIGGLVQKERKKIYAVLGTVFATAFLLIMIFILILGLSMG
jgi:hypothetical protein